MMMKKLLKNTIAALLVVGSLQVSAGNKDRIGEAGAQQLLINPYSRSAGWAGANSATAVGLEATYLNVAGLAETRKTELLVSRTSWLSGAGINVNAFGLSQRVGETSVLGLSVNSLGFGDVAITTEDLPEGGIGTFSPKLSTFNLAFAKEFSNSITGGMMLKVISESISNARAGGVAIDMGVRYVTGVNERVKFGISLKNVGPKMQYNGDGFSYTTTIDEEEFTVEWRTEGFELPSLLNIGASYDYYVNDRLDSASGNIISDHKLTGAFNFTANSFGKDQIRFGLEYGFKNMILLRGGYLYEQGVGNIDTRTTFNTGPTGGVTLRIPINQNGSTIDIDYAYRATNPMGGSHGIGLRVNL